MEKATDIEHRDFLLTCAIWQDSLLQSYRSFHVTIQCVLIAAGAAVFAVQLVGATQYLSAIFNGIFTGLVTFLFWLQQFTAKEIKEVVECRAKDVNFWHRAILLAENPLEPNQRTFTYFKMWQHANRASVEHVLPKFLQSDGLTEEKAEELVGKGTGHTRQVLDNNLFDRLQWLWKGMLVFSWMTTLYAVFDFFNP
ncbi:MAG: hypothetical protein Q7U23_02040 [Methylococcales bacterium]|nr:hypothetical protein [Methylococcales bacterium]